MPSSFALKSMNAVHHTVLRLTGGRFGWTAGNMPVLELTTTGRKSGQPRSVLLTSPWQDGETMAIIASAGGNDAHPAWYLNLEATSAVTVRTSNETRPMIARLATGEEREKIWAETVKRYKGYSGYQARTDRVIPVVVLEPAR